MLDLEVRALSYGARLLGGRMLAWRFHLAGHFAELTTYGHVWVFSGGFCVFLEVRVESV